MSDASISETPLRTTFKIKLNGKSVSIATVGQAHRFLTNLNSIEWMEFRSLHADAVGSLESAADNAMLTVPATNAVRVLFIRARML
jgi:hypothetical protein